MMGANHSLLQLMLELKQKGVTPIVMMPSHRLRKKNEGKTLADHLDLHGISYIPASFRMAKMRSALLTDAANVYNRLHYPLIARRLIGLNIDLIHSNSSVTDLGAYLSLKLGVPHVWHLREYGDLDYRLLFPWGVSGKKRYFRGNHRFIAISQSIAQHYAGLIPNSKISLIYNGINPPEDVSPDSRPTTCINIVCMGYLSPAKRQLDVVKSFRRLLEAGTAARPLHLFLAGRGEESYIREIKQYIIDNSLADNVTLTGQIDDITAFLSRMHIGVMSSACEAFGRVTVEYMMHSLAVVASDSGASGEIISPGVDGLLYPPGDTDALAACLDTLVKDPQLRAKIAAAGRCKACAQFTSRANTEAILGVYRQLLNTNSF